MSKRRQKNNHQNIPAYPSSIQELQRFKNEMAAVELRIIEKALTSDSPQSIVQAQQYLQNIEQKNKAQIKSFIFSPENEYNNSLGYKYKPFGLQYNTLRMMARTPQISAIIRTRQDQVANFSEPTVDMQKQGWTIRKKRSIFSDDKEDDISDREKKEIEYVINFILNGGTNSNIWEFESFEMYLRQLIKDSLEVDQGAFEIAYNRKGIPTQYSVVDGGTIRLADTYDDREYQETFSDSIPINGYYPSYVQIYNDHIYNEYYPWELCLGMRNKSSNIADNGYGVSELEILIQIVTWILFGMQYNGNFFQQGSNPKGFLNFKGEVDPTKLEQFKQYWSSSLTGVNNAHKMAAFQGGDVEWVNLMMNNKDMEFHQWNEFLTVLACAVYRTDPDEVGFHLTSSKGLFGQDGQKERLKHSKEKGRDSLLKFWSRQFTKYIVGPLSKGKYEFIWTGIDPEDEELVLEQDIKKLSNGGMAMQDFFLKYSGRKLKEKKDKN
mgnify:CR=1 FL=1